MSYIQINHIFRHCAEMWEFVQHFECFTFRRKLRVWQGIFDNIRLVLVISERPKVCFEVMRIYNRIKYHDHGRQVFFWPPVNFLWNHLSLSELIEKPKKSHVQSSLYIYTLYTNPCTATERIFKGALLMGVIFILAYGKRSL